MSQKHRENVTGIALSPYMCLKLFVIAPLLEEMLFRYMFINYLDGIEINKKIILSAIIFAILHIYLQGVAQVFYTFALGIICGDSPLSVYERDGFLVFSFQNPCGIITEN